MDEADHADVSEPSDSQAGELSAQQPPTDEWTPERIVAEFDREYDGTLSEVAIREAQFRRDEIVPHLIELIRRSTALVRDGVEPPGNGSLIALFLLAEFQAKEALPAILEAVSLPWVAIDKLFGEAMIDDFCRVLAVLATDLPEQIDALIGNRSLEMPVRRAAVQTYMCWVRDGRLRREQGVEKLRQHLRGAITNQDAELATALVYELKPYIPREAMQDITQAFELELVDESWICMEDIEWTLEEGEAYWQESLEYCPTTGVQDTLEELRDWSCYREDDEEFDDDACDEDNFDFEDWDDEDEGDEQPDVDFAQVFRDKMAQHRRLLDDAPLLRDDEFAGDWDDAGEQLRDDPPETIRRTESRVGRNEPCPCGSGKKFKKCCGKH